MIIGKVLAKRAMVSPDREALIFNDRVFTLIERVIREIPGIGDVSIIGIPDDTWGQVPKAFIEIQPGYPIAAQAVIDHCRSKLAGYKVPKQVEFIEQLPRTPSGKVLKRKLREL